MSTRPLRILLVHPGASWSTADVYDGLLYGLRAHGVIVDQYRLDTRIMASHKSLYWLWRVKQKEDPTAGRPNSADVMYHAGVGALEAGLRHQADVVLVVSAMLLHPDVAILMKRAGLRVVVLFTESPYDVEKELVIAKLVDGGWTNERTSLPAFRAVNANMGYLPHAWHPLKHHTTVADGLEMPAHDVVFVGTGFGERIDFFNRIDWRGIDLGLYGTWKSLGLTRRVRASVRAEIVTNESASALYRRAKICLNLHRNRDLNRLPVHGESLGPRAYELAACGAFHLSDARAEVRDVFGDLVPTFDTPEHASALIRHWLADDEGRARVAQQLPACVAEASWITRAATVLGDLSRLLQLKSEAA